MSTPCVGHFVSSIPYQEETKCPRKVRSLEHNYLCSSHCTSLFYLGRSIWRAHFYLRQEKPKKTVNPSFTVPLIWSTFTVSAPRDQIRNFPWQRLKEGSIGATLMNLNCRKGKLLPANRLFHHLASESRSLRLFYKKFLFISVFVTVIKCLKVTRIDLQRCYLIIFVFAWVANMSVLQVHLL